MQLSASSHLAPSFGHFSSRVQKRVLPLRFRCRATESEQDVTQPEPLPSTSTEAGKQPIVVKGVDKSATKFAKDVATTFAPRASGAVKNPAYKGSWLYNVFGWQAWGSMVVGAALSFNLIFPSDEPTIARLLGMWSIWMFTIPSLRARECTSKEKDALNILFLLVPLVNVTLPLIWKSFPFVFTSDAIVMAGVYYWKLGPPSEEQPST